MEEPENFLFSCPNTGKYEWNEDEMNIVFKKFSAYDKSSSTKTKPSSSARNQNKRKGLPSQTVKSDKKAVVTVEEIANVTFSRLKQSGMQLHYSQNLLALMKSKELKDLLFHFIQYFNTYFAILEFKKKFADGQLLPKRSQIADQEKCQDQLELQRYELALTYSAFLLLERQLYTSKQRIIYRPVDPAAEAVHDHKLFETVYWFLVFGVWITFSRNHFTDICKEIGDFTRSDMFNSLGRMGAARFSKNENEGRSMKDSYKTNLPKDLMTSQRSPALRLLIPESRDRVASLIRKLNTINRCPNPTARPDYTIQTADQRYGILGDVRYLYDEQLIAKAAEGGSDRAGTVSEGDNRAD